MLYNKCGAIVLAVVIIVFALWETAYSKWVIVIAAALLIIVAWMCKSTCPPEGVAGAKGKK